MGEGLAALEETPRGQIGGRPYPHRPGGKLQDSEYAYHFDGTTTLCLILNPQAGAALYGERHGKEPVVCHGRLRWLDPGDQGRQTHRRQLGYRAVSGGHQSDPLPEPCAAVLPGATPILTALAPLDCPPRPLAASRLGPLHPVLLRRDPAACGAGLRLRRAALPRRRPGSSRPAGRGRAPAAAVASAVGRVVGPRSRRGRRGLAVRQPGRRGRDSRPHQRRYVPAGAGRRGARAPRCGLLPARQEHCGANPDPGLDAGARERRSLG
jgi:hypothetical protein